MAGNVKRAPLLHKAVREFVLNIIPHIIGERSGIDGDGLPTDDIIELCRVISKHMPGDLNGQPIWVDVIRKYIDAGEKMLKKSIDIHGLIDMELINSGESREFWSNVRELEKIVLVAFPPRHLIDENEDERELYWMLKYSIEEGYSDALLLAHMRVYEEDVVNKVLHYFRAYPRRKKDQQSVTSLQVGSRWDDSRQRSSGLSFL